MPQDAPCLSIFRSAREDMYICSDVSTCGASELADMLPPCAPGFCSILDIRSMVKKTDFPNQHLIGTPL